MLIRRDATNFWVKLLHEDVATVLFIVCVSQEKSSKKRRGRCKRLFLVKMRKKAAIERLLKGRLDIELRDPGQFAGKDLL